MTIRSYYADYKRKSNGEKLCVDKDARFVDYIPRKNIAAFIKLFEKIEDREGGRVKAMKAIGIQHNVYYEMVEKNKLSAPMARRILNHYNKIKL